MRWRWVEIVHGGGKSAVGWRAGLLHGGDRPPVR